MVTYHRLCGWVYLPPVCLSRSDSCNHRSAALELLRVESEYSSAYVVDRSKVANGGVAVLEKTTKSGS